MKAPDVKGGRVQFTVRLPPQLYIELSKLAKKETRTMTSLVEISIKRYLDENR